MIDDTVDTKILVVAVGGETWYRLANKYIFIPVGIAANSVATDNQSGSRPSHDPRRNTPSGWMAFFRVVTKTAGPIEPEIE
jgi:hypothetical protein